MAFRRSLLPLSALLAIPLLLAHWEQRPAPLPAPAAGRRVRILRDRWGVPHVFGETDADAAYGLAYAHAEDDWPTIERVMAATRGVQARRRPSKDALAGDYLVALLGVWPEVEAQYPDLSPALRAVLEGYAEGLNRYAAKHPDEADSRLLPYTGKDVAAGFVFKLPLFMGLGRALQKARRGGLALPPEAGEAVGSNAHAVASRRSADGVTRLNINSHQPWEGPVAWYEAHVVSKEGWDMTGATFPGAPFLLIGHNDRLGWAMTVNRPDFVDAYRLTRHPRDPGLYRFEGGWEPFSRGEAKLRVGLGPLSWTIQRPVLRSRHGPVLETPQGPFAFRYAGMGRLIRAGEQWYRMNKAQDLAQFKAALRLQGIPMFNIVYADSRNILYLYNGLLPRRAEGFDYSAALPGDSARALWNDYLSFDELPRVENPSSGLLWNCNSSPFAATVGPGNPDGTRYPLALGIERGENNRALRSRELLGSDPSITRADFLAYKWDRAFSRESAPWKEVFAPAMLVEPRSPAEAEAVALLKGWDGTMEPDSPAAAVALLTYAPIHAAWWVGDPAPSPEEAFREAVSFLVRHHGGPGVPLGRVHRIRRGGADLPLGGGPDVLNAVDDHEVSGGTWEGKAGDSYVLVAEFPRAKPARSWAVHQYGASSRPGGRHYADQLPLFTGRRLRPSLRTEAEVRAQLEREYQP